MKKPTKIRTEPVSLNESTLETNIAIEIGSLFRNPTGLNYSSRLRWFFDIPYGVPLSHNYKKVKVYRLTPSEEYHGGGWDSKIVIPNEKGDSRAVFIQFKSGKYSDGNEFPNSIFNRAIINPNIHADFTFNNNSNNNQHQTLKNLHNEVIKQGFPSKSVLYGFPRITDLETFDRLEEDLLLHTTFLSISEMDLKATTNGISLYDNEEHHFRTCYYDETRREIASRPFSMGLPDDPSGFLYEVLLIKFAEWRNQFKEDIPIKYLNEEFYFMLANFLRINPFNLYNFDNPLKLPLSIVNEEKDYYLKLEDKSAQKLQEIFNSNVSNQDYLKWRRDLFEKIVNFVADKSAGYIDVSNDIPSNYSFSLSNRNMLEMRFQEDASYNLLLF